MGDSIKVVGISLGVAILLAFISLKITEKPQKEKVIKKELIRVGGFSKDIEKLQRNINNFAKADLLEINGAYSNKMKTVILEIFKNTEYLVDSENGAIDVLRLKELNLVLENINKLNK